MITGLILRAAVFVDVTAGLGETAGLVLKATYLSRNDSKYVGVLAGWGVDGGSGGRQQV